jgi:predicted adenine nucleotide alpha hydrolase (AANH) superfamily ATPase
LKADGFDVVGLFYGSNIHPEDEYAQRADALARLSACENFEVVSLPYEPEAWLSVASKFADEPERGARGQSKRCALCFELQLRAAASEGARLGASHFCTTLTISPHKDAALISSLGREISSRHGLVWEDRIWRKNNGFLRSIQVSKELGLYRQSYCGCVYSKEPSTVFSQPRKS